MSATKNYKRHAALVDKMAGLQGLDLEELIMRGKLQIDSLGDAVLRCTGCSNPDGCEAWMQQVEGPVAGVPEMCRNADLFELLKAGKHA